MDDPARQPHQIVLASQAFTRACVLQGPAGHPLAPSADVVHTRVLPREHIARRSPEPAPFSSPPPGIPQARLFFPVVFVSMRAFFRGRGVLLRLRMPSLTAFTDAFAPQSLLGIERLPGLVAAGGPNAPVTIHGRHCHSTLSLTVTDCYSLGIYTVILLSHCCHFRSK